MSTPYGYQPDPDQAGQGSQYQPTQYAPAPQYGQPAQPDPQPQTPQYGQAPGYGQAPPAAQYGQGSDQGAQYGQGSDQGAQYGQPSYGQTPAPQYGSAPGYGQAPGYDPSAGQYGQQAQAGYGQAPQYGQPGYGQQPGGQQAYGGYGPVPGGVAVQRSPYLSGADVGFGAAITEALKNTFNYQGRISKSSYWFAAGPALGVMVLFYIIAIASGSVGLIILEVIVDLVIAVVMLSVAWRRLQDTGKSGALSLLWIIPFGFIAVLVLCSLDPTPGPNQYGDWAGSAGSLPGGYGPPSY